MASIPFPEELIREILRIVLLPDIHQFFELPSQTSIYRAQTSPSSVTKKEPHSPPSRYPHSLLVSKCWLRIGSPLLYSFIRFSRPVHIATVAKTLRLYPRLGSRMRHLRIDCSYESLEEELQSILVLPPTLTSVYFGFDAEWPSPSPSLLEALFAIRPTSLYISFSHSWPFPTNHKRSWLGEAVARHWTSLVWSLDPQQPVTYIRRRKSISAMSSASSTTLSQPYKLHRVSKEYQHGRRAQ